MEQKKIIGIGFRGWMLVLWLATAFLAYTVIGNYPLNILADLYGGAQTLSTIYTVASVIGIVIQLAISGYVGKLKSIRMVSLVLGILTILSLVGIMFIPMASPTAWQIMYGVGTVISVMYGTFAISILVGQWFPTRKGTIMGIATLAFPLGNGLLGPFAASVFRNGAPNVAGAFLPFLIVIIVGWILGLIFVKDYPEQCGAYRDNNKNLTPEIAQKMMLEEIENKKTTVWKTGHTLKCIDFWLITVPMGALLLFAVGTMTQTAAIIGSFEELNYGQIMGLLMIFGCIGSYVLGLLDTKFGTKTAIIIAILLMILAGILGSFHNPTMLTIALICMAIFMGASSNFTVSGAVQYWRREDFPSVFAVVNPVANLFNAVGPMIIVMLLYSALGYRMIFIATAIGGVVSLVLILLFKPSRVKEVDDKYRRAAGKPLDDALAGRR